MVTFLFPLLLAAGLTAQEPEKVGPGVTPPVPIYKVEPSYTQEAKEAKLEGTVVLSIVIEADGAPSQVKVLKHRLYYRETQAESTDDLGLGTKAVECIGQWKFRPAAKEGKPIAVQATVEMTFRLL